ncbi:hypothetical protein C5F53_06900 [Rhodoferax sp. TS-BS-61-7]|nr:hypothetical protein C5F53_06900 [Rhodoferax sp. TS-BS-61-7]
MALTMTRTRTQTTLTKLAEMVANVHGELAFLEGLLAGEGTAGGAQGAGRTQELCPEVRMRLDARRERLLADRDALYATVRQFDASIAPECIGTAEGWRKGFGRVRAGSRLLTERYIQRLLH